MIDKPTEIGQRWYYIAPNCERTHEEELGDVTHNPEGCQHHTVHIHRDLHEAALGVYVPREGDLRRCRACGTETGRSHYEMWLAPEGVTTEPPPADPDRDNDWAVLADLLNRLWARDPSGFREALNGDSPETHVTETAELPTYYTRDQVSAVEHIAVARGMLMGLKLGGRATGDTPIDQLAILLTEALGLLVPSR